VNNRAGDDVGNIDANQDNQHHGKEHQADQPDAGGQCGGNQDVFQQRGPHHPQVAAIPRLPGREEFPVIHAIGQQAVEGVAAVDGFVFFCQDFIHQFHAQRLPVRVGREGAGDDLPVEIVERNLRQGCLAQRPGDTGEGCAHQHHTHPLVVGIQDGTGGVKEGAPVRPDEVGELDSAACRTCQDILHNRPARVHRWTAADVFIIQRVVAAHLAHCQHQVALVVQKFHHARLVVDGNPQRQGAQLFGIARQHGIRHTLGVGKQAQGFHLVIFKRQHGIGGQLAGFIQLVGEAFVHRLQRHAPEEQGDTGSHHQRQEKIRQGDFKPDGPFHPHRLRHIQRLDHRIGFHHVHTSTGRVPGRERRWNGVPVRDI